MISNWRKVQGRKIRSRTGVVTAMMKVVSTVKTRQYNKCLVVEMRQSTEFGDEGDENTNYPTDDKDLWPDK